jgi:hypothetical protein
MLKVKSILLKTKAILWISNSIGQVVCRLADTNSNGAFGIKNLSLHLFQT